MYERYTQMVMYENYLLDLDLQQKEMTKYVNECIALSNPDKKQAISELAILNEGKIGDKFKKVWARIKSFFSKIYQKFLESLAAWSNDNQDYLKQYYNIIFEKKVTLKSVKMKPHFDGLDRFNTMISNISAFSVVPKFEMMVDDSSGSGKSKMNQVASDNMANDAQKNNEAVTKYQQEQQAEVVKKVFGVSDAGNVIDENEPSTYAAKCREYLNGGADDETYNSSDIEQNMKRMYSFLYQQDTLVDNLKKIREAYDKGMENIEKEYKKSYDDVVKRYKNSADKNTFKTDINTNGSALNDELKNAKKDGAEADQKIKEQYSLVYGKVINEDGAKITTGGSNGSQQSTNTVVPTNSPNTTDTKTLDAKNKATNKDFKDRTSTTKSNNKESSNATSAAGTANALDNVSKGATEEQLAQFETASIDLLRAFGNARSLLMGAALNALTDTRNDFMAIIRAHVRSWVGQTEGPDQSPEEKQSMPTGKL